MTMIAAETGIERLGLGYAQVAPARVHAADDWTAAMAFVTAPETAFAVMVVIAAVLVRQVLPAVNDSLG